MIHEAIILVGGKGTRLQSVVSDRPKPMALVAGRPFLDWLLLALHAQGITRVVLAAGYMAEMLRQHYEGNSDFDLDVTVAAEATPLGTGGAARNAAALLGGERVAVLNGDSYCPFDLEPLAHAQEATQAEACIWLVHEKDCDRFGSVELDGDNRVVEFREKGSSSTGGLINAGVYLIRRDVLMRLPPAQAISMEREVLPTLALKGTLRGVVGTGPFTDIGTPESYQAVSAQLGPAFQQLLSA